jgi:hypothetical protein
MVMWMQHTNQACPLRSAGASPQMVNNQVEGYLGKVFKQWKEVEQEEFMDDLLMSKLGPF